jgi:hypothetical protein
MGHIEPASPVAHIWSSALGVFREYFAAREEFLTL